MTNPKQNPYATSLSTLVFSDYSTFYVLDKTVNLFSDQLDFGINTVAEIDGQVYYLGEEQPTMSAAIYLWEYLNNRELTEEELRKVLTENKFLPDA